MRFPTQKSEKFVTSGAADALDKATPRRWHVNGYEKLTTTSGRSSRTWRRPARRADGSHPTSRSGINRYRWIVRAARVARDVAGTTAVGASVDSRWTNRFSELSS